MSTLSATFRDYYNVTKPGIIRGNLMTAAAGFLFASKGHYNFGLLLWLLAGTSLIIASACVYNNYLDRNIDKHMKRTAIRAIVTGKISSRAAIIYATLLGALGFIILSLNTNMLVVAIGAIGIFSYVIIYGYYKRHSVYSTIIGSISGATSLVAGYSAVSGRIDKTAAVLLLIMAIWQIPHFYAIGIYRIQDYADASLPVLPVVRGIPAAKKHILFYISLYILASCFLTILGSAGYVYLAVMLVGGTLWLRPALRGFKMKDNVKYGHQIFGFSLVVLLTFSIMISITYYLP